MVPSSWTWWFLFQAGMEWRRILHTLHPTTPLGPAKPLLLLGVLSYLVALSLISSQDFFVPHLAKINIVYRSIKFMELPRRDAGYHYDIFDKAFYNWLHHYIYPWLPVLMPTSFYLPLIELDMGLWLVKMEISYAMIFSLLRRTGAHTVLFVLRCTGTHTVLAKCQ